MGAGLSVLHFSSTEGGTASQAAARASTFFDGLKTILPPTVTVQVANVVELRTDNAGSLTGTTGVATQPIVTGTGSATGLAAGVGMRVRWATEGIRNGRAVIGTTFIVPVPAAGYEANGTLASTYITAAQTAASALITGAATDGCPLGVWSRPSVAAGDGAFHLVTAAVVPDQVSWLTTRRS